MAWFYSGTRNRWIWWFWSTYSRIFQKIEKYENEKELEIAGIWRYSSKCSSFQILSLQTAKVWTPKSLKTAVFIWYWMIQIFCSAVNISVRIKFLKLPTTIQFPCDGMSEWYLCIRTLTSLTCSEGMFVIMLSYAELLIWSEWVLIIRSPTASPAFKCECGTSSTLSSYICFSPRFRGGINWYRE